MGLANGAPLDRNGWRKLNGSYGNAYRKMAGTTDRARMTVRVGVLVRRRDRLYSNKADE